MSDVVQQLAHALKDQPANPLRNHQVEEYTREKDRLESMVGAPAFVPGNRGRAAAQARALSKMVDNQIARPLQGEKKDQVAQLAQDVMENVIRPALVPREDMRRNPAGAVGRFIRNENARPIKQAVQHWKRAQLALEPGNEDPDLANVERFRPEKIHDTGGAATFMPGAQIPGNFAMTPQAKANWPLGEPQVETPLKQAQKREVSEAQKAALIKARATAAANRAAKAQEG